MGILCKENDNIDQAAIDKYMQLSDEELDKLLAEKLKETKDN